MVAERVAMDHYAALGLDLTATPTEIGVALDALADEARTAVAESPHRADAIWAQIRQVRADLLGERALREAYDLRVLAVADGLASAEGMGSALSGSFVAPVRPRLVVAEAASRARSAALLWPAIAAVLAFLLIGGVVLGRQLSSGHPSARPQPAATAVPTVGGAVASAGSFKPGQHVVLRWAPLQGASQYRVQVATGRNGRVTNVRLRHPSFGFSVAGGTIYAWRVQALVHGRWTPFGRTSRFTVETPALGQPVPLLPAQSALSGNQVQFCWSPVARAIAYRLSISRLPAKVERNACASVALRAGTYRWSVRALSKGGPNHVGPASRRSSFTVRRHEGRALVAAVTRIRAHATTGRRVSRRATRRTSHRAVRHSSHAAAFHAARRVHSTHKSIRRARRSRSTSGHRPTSSAGVVPTRVTTVTRTTHQSVHHGTPATQTKPVHARVPAPPPPPPPPVPLRTPTGLPTPRTSIAGAPVSSGGSYGSTVSIPGSYTGQPTVLPKSPTPSTGGSRPATPTSTTPPIVVPPTTGPTSQTGGGNNGKQHPIHPEHPVHPVHPVHPTHP